MGLALVDKTRVRHVGVEKRMVDRAGDDEADDGEGGGGGGAGLVSRTGSRKICRLVDL